MLVCNRVVENARCQLRHFGADRGSFVSADHFCKLHRLNDTHVFPVLVVVEQVQIFEFLESAFLVRVGKARQQMDPRVPVTLSN